MGNTNGDAIMQPLPYETAALPKRSRFTIQEEEEVDYPNGYRPGIPPAPPSLPPRRHEDYRVDIKGKQSVEKMAAYRPLSATNVDDDGVVGKGLVASAPMSTIKAQEEEDEMAKRAVRTQQLWNMLVYALFPSDLLWQHGSSCLSDFGRGLSGTIGNLMKASPK